MTILLGGYSLCVAAILAAVALMAGVASIRFDSAAWLRSARGVVGREIVESNGGRIAFVSQMPGFSTTSILAKRDGS